MDIHNVLSNVLPNISSEVNYINHGGCGHYAHQLHMALAEQGIDSSIVLVDVYYSTGSVNWLLDRWAVADINAAYRKMFANGRDNTAGTDPCFGHICLRVGDTLYDSDGSSNHCAISEAIDADVLALSFTVERTWNSTFKDCNKRGVVAKMRKFIKRALDNAASEVVA